MSHFETMLAEEKRNPSTWSAVDDDAVASAAAYSAHASL